MKLKHFICTLILTAVLALPAFAQTALDLDTYPCGDHLFNIAKSDNKNVLFYDAVIVNGKLDVKNPVDIYWIMYAEKNQREGMTFLEKPQFGINTKAIEPGKKYIIHVKNDILASRDINVFLDNNTCARATAVINGQEALIQDIFINIKPDSGMIPDVESLDLKGIALEDQSAVTERVYNK